MPFRISNRSSGADLGTYWGVDGRAAIRAMLEAAWRGGGDPDPDLVAEPVLLHDAQSADWGLDDLVPAAQELAARATPRHCPNCGADGLKVRVRNQGGDLEFRADCDGCGLRAVYWTLAGLVGALETEQGRTG